PDKEKQHQALKVEVSGQFDDHQGVQKIPKGHMVVLAHVRQQFPSKVKHSQIGQDQGQAHCHYGPQDASAPQEGRQGKEQLVHRGATAVVPGIEIAHAPVELLHIGQGGPSVLHKPIRGVQVGVHPIFQEFPVPAETEMIGGEAGLGKEVNQAEQYADPQQKIEVPFLELHDLEQEKEEGRIEHQQLGEVRTDQIVSKTEMEQGGSEGKKYRVFMQPPVCQHGITPWRSGN